MPSNEVASSLLTLLRDTRIVVFLLFPFEFQFTVGTGDLLSGNRDLDLNGAQFSARAVAGGGDGSRDVTSTSTSKSRRAREVRGR